MDETLQKDIFDILKKENRYDLIAVMITLFEEMDSDYEPESSDEPPEEYMEGGSIQEDCDYGETSEGFYYLK
tara:strand:+ start:284 stop:499 length:216 start_codon:yes stop_codon:yes gene_type:complete